MKKKLYECIMLKSLNQRLKHSVRFIMSSTYFSGDNLLILGGTTPTTTGETNHISNAQLISMERENNCFTHDLSYRVSGHASVYVPILRGIVTCGGLHKSNETGKCIIQSKGNVSTYFPSMNSERSNFGIISVGKQIFAIGGEPNRSSMEIIDVTIKNGQWKQQAIPFGVSYHCVVKFEKTLILTGGYDGNGVSRIANS